MSVRSSVDIGYKKIILRVMQARIGVGSES